MLKDFSYCLVQVPKFSVPSGRVIMCHVKLCEQSSTMEKKSNIPMLNNNGPSIEPWGTPDRILYQELYVSDILVLCLREVR